MSLEPIKHYHEAQNHVYEHHGGFIIGVGHVTP